MRPFSRGSLLKGTLLPPVLLLSQFPARKPGSGVRVGVAGGGGSVCQCCLWGGRGAVLCGSSGAGRDSCPDLHSESMAPPQPRAVIIVHFHSSLGPPAWSLCAHSLPQSLILTPSSPSPSVPYRSVPHSLSSSLIPSIPHSLPHSLTMQAHSSFYSPEPPKGWILNRCTIQVHYGIN